MLQRKGCVRPPATSRVRRLQSLEHRLSLPDTSQLLSRLAAVVQDDDLHGKETIDLSEVEVQKKEEEELYEKSRQSIHEEEEYTPTAAPMETELYEALGVVPDSSPGQIKKAYYKLAMTHHPDKGGDTDKFQKIGDAYQVLSDVTSRKKYDEKGMAGLEKQNMMDPGVVFMMMFGDSQFEHLVGDLAIVQQQRLADKGLEPAALAAKLKELHSSACKPPVLAAPKLAALPVRGAGPRARASCQGGSTH